MTEKMKISGNMITGVKAAEEALAREEAKGLEDALPEGHPLKEEVEKQKAMMGGDLSGLPPGHPLIRALQHAKRSYDAKKAVEDTKEQFRTQIRKVKKIDPNAAKRVERAREDDESEHRISSAGMVNNEIQALLLKVKDLYGILAQHEESLNTDPFSRTKVLRLKRMMMAMERGLADCRIARL